MNSTIITRASRAIHLESSQDCVIDGNTISKDRDDFEFLYGIYVYDSIDLTISNNTIDNSSYTGIEISDSSNLKIKDNEYKMRGGNLFFYKYGMNMYNNENILVEGNSFDGPNVGINLNYNEDLEINNNNFINCTERAIESWDSSDLIIEGNIININNIGGFGTTAIYLWESINLQVKNNSISGFSYVDKNNIGLAIDGFNKLFVYNNNIKDAAVGIQFMNKNQHSIIDVLIAGNIIHDLKPVDNNAFWFMDSSEMIVVANLFYNVYRAFNQESTEDIVYDGNVFWSNVTYGYFLRYGSTAVIINATVNELPPFTVYLNISSEVDLIDAKFNLTSLRLSDKTCEARIHWTINVRIKDHYGNYIPDIFLRIRSIVGTILYEDTTDNAGFIRNLVIMERIQLYADNITYTPTSFEAEYANHTAYLETSIGSEQNVTLQLGNSAPNVYNIIINPQFPKTTDTLTLDLGYTYLDNENDIESDTYFKWFRNGNFVPELENQTVVPAIYTKKGEIWFCQVTPGDSLIHGDPGNSLTVLIFNTKPTASAVDLSPKNPDGLVDLTVNYSYYDIDDDSELGTQFHWYADAGSGYQLRASTSLPMLASSYTNEGETWYVEVEPKDGEDSGDTYGSNAITIGNTIPRVENAYVTPDDPSSSSNISVKYTFIDIDGDFEAESKYDWYIDTGSGFGFLYSGISNRTVEAKYLTKGYIWMCKITPFDGEVYGPAVNSTTVTIGNTPPVISNLMIVPGDPKTTENLTVSYDFSDRDSDLENESLYEWFKVENSQLVKTGLKVKTLPSLFTLSGETWVCEVIPFDGVDFGMPVQSSPVMIGNKAPVVSDMSITPHIPYTTDNLTAYYSYSDDDGDPESDSEIKWYKNGEHETQLDNELSVPWSYTSRGDEWYFVVIPGDGGSRGLTYTCPPVTIENTPPEITDVEILPKTAYTNDDLGIEFNIFDPDGDNIKSTEITWYLNGDIQGLYQDEETIPASATSKGQVWKSVIRVSDGDGYSQKYESRSVVIKNSAPEIIEFFPETLQIEIDETESTSFAIEVNDIDNDRLLYQWRENDNSVDDDQSYTLKTDYNSAGDYTINVTVQDFGTGSIIVSKQWQVTVKNINRIPVMQIKAPLDPHPTVRKGKTLSFDVSYSDLDIEDTPMIIWYLDDEAQTSGETTFVVDPENLDLGLHTLEAVVSDGSSSVSYMWNVTVLESTEHSDEYLGLKWDQWSIVLEGLVVGITGLIAFLGFLRLRKKKGALQRYMKQIEDDMKNWKDDPDKAEKKLITMSETIETDFTHGKIEDFHYFLLDRQIKESLREIRQTKIKRDFTALPDHLRKELNLMLEDGRITDKEYKSFVGTISKSEGISTQDKEGLRKLMRTWKDVDASEGGKNVSMKEISVSKKKKKSKFMAKQLGWEDFSTENKYESAESETGDTEIPGDETELEEDAEEWHDDGDENEPGDSDEEEEVWQ
jgi:parallel beta-helix repeat protein